MPNQVQAFIRPEGRDGYIVGLAMLNGAPVLLRKFEAEERIKAVAYKEGVERGMLLAANILEGVVKI